LGSSGSEAGAGRSSAAATAQSATVWVSALTGDGLDELEAGPGGYQIVSSGENDRIFRSLVTTATPWCRAVAAIIRSAGSP